MATTKIHEKHPLGRSGHRLVLFVVLLLLLYVVVPQLGGFSDSLRTIGSADLTAVAVAAVLTFGSYGLASCMYQLLAKRQLKWSQTVPVQLASGFATRLLPAGLGGLTLNVQYLRHSKHSLPAALAVAGMNNTLGFIGHLLLMTAVLVLGQNVVPADIKLGQIPDAAYVVAGAVVLVLLNLLAFRRVRRYLYALTRDVAHQFFSYRHRRRTLIAALGCSLVLTSTCVAILFFCAQAIGVDLSPAQAFIVFSAGVLVGTITPTPGGLLGAEAGLAGACLAYGVPSADAIAIALLFRLLTYWMPMVPGFAIFMAIRKKYL